MKPATAVARNAVLESHWVTVDGVRIHARVSPEQELEERPPLVLVHGLGVSSRYMVPAAVELSDTYRVLAPDLPGFGRSGRPRHAPDIAGLADALVSWMDAMGLESVPMLGNSFGCQVVVSLALMHPGRITCAVLGGPSVDPTERTAFQQIRHLLADGFREPRTLLPIVVFDYIEAGLPRVWKTFRYLLDDPIEQKLPHVQMPVLVVRGEFDPIVPQDWAESAVALLPNARLVVVPGATHALNYSAPRQLARITRTFVGDGRASGGS